MTNKLVWQICFLLLAVATIALAFKSNPGGVGTGMLWFLMLITYITGDSPKDG